MTAPELHLTRVQRDALARALRLGGLYPTNWNWQLRKTLEDRGLVAWVDTSARGGRYQLTAAGVAAARRVLARAAS